MNCFSKRRRRTWEKPFYAFSNDDRRTNQYRPIKESFQAEESVNFFGDEIMIPCAQWLRLSDAVQNGMEGGGELTKLINWFEAVADSTTLPVIEILQFDYKYQRDEAHLIQLFCDPQSANLIFFSFFGDKRNRKIQNLISKSTAFSLPNSNLLASSDEKTFKIQFQGSGFVALCRE